MKNRMSQIILSLTMAGIVSAAPPADDPDQSDFPQITHQPVDIAVRLGSNAVFQAQAINGNVSFQWFRNGVVMDGQTNSQLVLENVDVADAGLYTCNIAKDGGESVPSRTATLNVFMMADASGGPITVYGAPILGSGSQGTCPGAYAGYVNYMKPVSQGWGWPPSTNTTVHTASDLNRTDTKVQYVGKTGDVGCNQTSVTVPHPTLSLKYRFTIYFPNNVPTTNYPITLSGFEP